MTHRCLISCEDYCENRRLQTQLRSGIKTLAVTIMHVDEYDNETGEVTYAVTMYWEGGGWFLDTIEPYPETPFIEEKVMEQAAQMADEAVANALDDAADVRNEWRDR